MRVRRIAAVLLLAAVLAGCQSKADGSLAEIPKDADFIPAGEAAGFDVSGKLLLYPHHELMGGGLATFMVNVKSLSNRNLRNLRTVVFYPEEIVEVGQVFEPYLVSPRSYDLTAEQPSYGLGQTFTFPDWGQVDAVRALAEQPLRVRLVWDGGQRFLEIPPEAITVTQEAEPRRLPNDPDLFAYPAHPAFVDHLGYSEGRYLSRASGVTATDLLDWYRAEMPSKGWEPLPAPDRALLFRKEDLFLSLSATDEPGGMATMWSHMRSTAEVPEEDAIRIVRARYPEDRENQWAAEYRSGGSDSGATAPVWEVKGLRGGEVWVIAWVDAVTAELRLTDPGEPLPVPPSSSPNVPSQATPEAIRATKLNASLKSSTGKKVQVYLYATDERTNVQDVPSCMAQHGDTLRTGTYKFYTASEGESDLHLQSVSPFEDALLSFNDQRPEYIEVFPTSTAESPDLLMLMQYGSCNGNSLAILAISPDGTRLVQYRFRTDDGRIRKTVGTKVVLLSLPGTLQTSVYNNATGKTTTTIWGVRDDDAEVVEVKTEVR